MLDQPLPNGFIAYVHMEKKHERTTVFRSKTVKGHDLR